MTITPAGYPPWRRLNTPATYGATANKKNYGGIGAINGQTDIDVTEYVAMGRDVAAAQNTAPWATLRVKLNDSTTSNPTLLEYSDMAGGVGPVSIVRNADNDFTITWTAEPADPFGVTAPINILGARASVNGSTPGVCTDERLDTNVDGNYEAVRIYAHDLGVATLTDPEISIVVQVGQSV